MENASKALIMAGGVLISLIIIALLVIFFNNLSDLQNTKLTSEEVEQAAEFNKQFDVYARDLYGSELLSLANKVVDYNKRESDNKGYQPIVLEVKFTEGLSDKYFIKGTYGAEELYNITANKKNENNLEKYVETLGDVVVYSTDGKYSRKISKISTMRTKDLKDLGFEESAYRKALDEYNKYKNLLSDMKQKVFTYVNFDYDKNTGRIIKMSYKLPNEL